VKFDTISIVARIENLSRQDVDAADIDGYTALHLACRAGHLNIVEYLIESGGANVDAKAGVKRQTAFYIASEHDS
jgi:ankyrin repeat protein